MLQDVLTLHGSQFKDATVIVASPPCQAYSYRAMPWKRAKALPPPSNELFDACFRIQREACEAAGHHIPLIVENVRGAQPWVGRAKWNFGSFYLWGDVPALMPMTKKLKQPGRNFHFPEKYGIPSPSFHGADDEPSVRAAAAIKNNGGSWFAVAHNTESGHSRNPVNGEKGIPHRPTGHWTNPAENGTKVSGDWFGSYAEQKAAGTISPGRLHGKNSLKRKAASAQIAKIPFPLAQHIARVFTEGT